MSRGDDLQLRDPIPGESLDGFVAEIVGINDLRKVRAVSGAGGITHGHRPQLTTTGWRDLPDLADLLEVDVAELQHRSYPLVGTDGSRRAFFGTTVHRSDLRIRQRFFSPSALRVSPHHRAMWQLRLPYDAGNGELLVSKCPRVSWCGDIQRWRHSAGVRYCDSCVQDLAEQEVPTLGDDVLPDYKLAAGLTHTDPARREESLSLLPERIQALGADMAFELLLRLGPVVDPDCRWSQGSRIWANEPDVIARSMARAWRTLAGWPSAFVTSIAADLGAGGARFDDGRGGATGRFLRLRNGEGVAPAVAAEIAAVHSAISIDGPTGTEAISCQEASALTGVSTRILVPMRREGLFRTVAVSRGPLLLPYLDRSEMLSVRDGITHRWDMSRAAPVLGLPYYGVEQLCALGRLPTLEHRYFAARYPEPQITEAAVDAFVADIAHAALPELDGTVPLLHAIRRVGGRLKPWDAIIEAMLAEDGLPFALHPDGTSLLDRVRVRPADLLWIASTEITRPCAETSLSQRIDPDFRFAGVMTKCDAGEVLNIRTRQFTPLLSRYPTSSSRVVPMDDVLRLAAAFISSTEIAERLGVPYQSVRGRMSKVGLVASSEAGFCRASVERLMFSG